MNNYENQFIAKKEKLQEVIDIPDIQVKEEKGVSLLSLALKAHNKSLEESGVDEETLYNIALTYNHPEREQALYDFISKHKDYIDDPKELRNKIIELLSDTDDSLTEEVKAELQEAPAEDIKKRQENLEATKKRIENLIDFFKPNPDSTIVQYITILPTGILDKKESGNSYNFGNELIIRSHIDNPKNLDHEFLHSIINPIVDKLTEKLSEEQRKKIVDSASHNLKVEQRYGEDYYSLLAEEFIRTYNDVIQNNESPISLGDFVEKINRISEGDFEKNYNKSEKFKKRCEELGIKNAKDLKRVSSEYYEKFEKNELREIIFNFYQDYIKEKEVDEEINFEKFASVEFNKRI
jgi:hypothetical protein